MATSASARAAPPLQPRAADADDLGWLSQFVHDVRNQRTPIGAFIATLPQPPKRRAKTSSERGKAFRERQRQHELELERHVEALRSEVATLHMRRAAWETRCLKARHDPLGSLAQLVHEYHRLFRHGLVTLPTLPAGVGHKRGLIDEQLVRQVARQEEFLRRAMDPEAVVGNLTGPEESITQWRRYTSSHQNMVLETLAIEIVGSEEDPKVICRCELRSRFALDTIRMMFPHVLKNRPLLAKLLGNEIVYPATRRFQFSPDGRIIVESVDVDFVSGLMYAGCTLEDIAEVMSAAAVNSESMITDSESPSEVEFLEDDTYEEVVVEDGHEPSTIVELMDEVAEHVVCTMNERGAGREGLEQVESERSPSPTGSPTLSPAPSDQGKPLDRLSLAFLLSDATGA